MARGECLFVREVRRGAASRRIGVPAESAGRGCRNQRERVTSDDGRYFSRTTMLIVVVGCGGLPLGFSSAPGSSHCAPHAKARTWRGPFGMTGGKSTCNAHLRRYYGTPTLTTRKSRNDAHHVPASTIISIIFHFSWHVGRGVPFSRDASLPGPPTSCVMALPWAAPLHAPLPPRGLAGPEREGANGTPNR